MFNWFRRPPPAPPAAPPRDPGSFWTTHAAEMGQLVTAADVIHSLQRQQPRPEGVAQDDDSYGLKFTANISQGVPDALAMWYASQGFIGFQMAALVAQHWLVAKACAQPGRDAIRNGYDIVSVDGDPLDPKALKLLQRADRRMRLRSNLLEFVTFGRVFGQRIALFLVDSDDADYYEKPFNLDGVKPGSYRGIVQVDPYWTAPLLSAAAISDPSSIHFYEPTYWQINGKKYHRSHLVRFIADPVPDVLKPSYFYGGVPVPQQILERVYASERVANEAPQLAQTKRTTVWQTDMAAFIAKGNEAVQRLMEWTQYRDNYGVKLGDKEGDAFQQFDTSLADLDATIMTQYQLVAAVARVPATKLLGTSPKGFGASGDYETESYHEELESLQEHSLSDLVERHHALVMRSDVVPRLGIDPVETIVTWRPLDTPTAKEQAETNLVKAQTGAALASSGAIDGEDERRRVATDPTSGYHGIGLEAPEADPDEDEDEPVAG